MMSVRLVILLRRAEFLVAAVRAGAGVRIALPAAGIQGAESIVGSCVLLVNDTRDGITHVHSRALRLFSLAGKLPLPPYPDVAVVIGGVYVGALDRVST